MKMDSFYLLQLFIYFVIVSVQSVDHQSVRQVLDLCLAFIKILSPDYVVRELLHAVASRLVRKCFHFETIIQLLCRVPVSGLKSYSDCRIIIAGCWNREVHILKIRNLFLKL